MANKDKYHGKSATFQFQGKRQFVTVERNRDGSDVVRRRLWPSKAILDETVCSVPDSGCGIEQIALSPSGTWIVTQRFSGEGEWGYDVFQSCPLARAGGRYDDYGYMLDLPQFSPDESRLVGGFGESWQGGWWAHADDDFEDPARGGKVNFGYLFIHYLPSHRVKRHKLRMNLPKGWLPEDPESPMWYGARDIGPAGEGVRLTLPGGVAVEIDGPLPPVILLPTPHPGGGRLLADTSERFKPR